MSTITLPNIRVSSDLTVKVRLKDGGVAIDWSTLSNLRAWIYSDAQSSFAGRCDVTVDGEDATLLVCRYAATRMQYLGVNRIVVSARYMGAAKTYDKPVLNFVRWTEDQAGEQITIEDPEVTVEIDVEDISSSILQEAVDAAFSAAVRADEAAAAAEHMVDIHQGPPGPAGKAPYVDATTGNWFVWDDQTEQYVDSGNPAQGPAGNGIASWNVVESQEDGGSNVVTVVFTNGESESFTVKNGNTGATPNFAMGIVETGAAGSRAEAQITGTPANPILSLKIPQGEPGVAAVRYIQVDTLPSASSHTLDALYLVPTNTADVYDVYYTTRDGQTYSWVKLCTTSVQLSDYATKAEVSQLEAEVDEKIGFETKIPSAHDGYTLYSENGTLYTSIYVADRGVTDFVPVVGGGTLSIQSGVYQGNNTAYCSIAFYASNTESSFVSSIKNTTPNTEITNAEFPVPASANYARFVMKDKTIPVIFGGYSGTVKDYVDSQIATVEGEIDAVNDRIDNLPVSSPDGAMSDTSENAVQNKVIKGYIDDVTGLPIPSIPSAHDGYTLYSENGTLYTSIYVADRGVTDFVPVVGGGTLSIQSGAYQGNNTAYCSIAFYASNTESSFVSSIKNTTPNTEITNAEFPVPASANYARFVMKDKTIPVILGVGKSIKEMLAELAIGHIAKNEGKSIVVIGGSHTARENSEAAKNIWREKLGMDVYTAGVGSCGIMANVTMYGWTYNGVSYYTRGGYNDGVGSRVWDDYGYLSNVSITATGENTITLSDGNTYSRDTTKDYVNNAQTKISRLLSKSALDKNIYVIWLSTNDYVQTQPLGTFSDYTEVDNYDTTKKWTDTTNKGTICGGFNFILKTIRENNPTAEIYLFTSFRYFNDDAKGYNPFSTSVNGTGKNFYEYQQEVMKAAQAGGCAILDQFMLQGVGIGNYNTFYESDHLHLKVSGYEKIGYIQAEFLANGK